MAALGCVLLVLPALILCMFLLSTVPARGAVPKAETTESAEEPRDKATLERAKELLETDQLDAAIAMLENFLIKYPRSEFVDDAYLLLATALIRTKQQAEALTYLDQLLREYPTSELTVRARLMMGVVHIERGNLDAALPILGEARSLAVDPETKLEAIRLIRDIQVKKGDYHRAIQSSLEELELAPEDQRHAVLSDIRSLVQGKMDPKALRRLHEAYPTAFPGDMALIRLIELELARGEEHLAERDIRIFLKRFPSHDYVETAGETLRSLKAKLKSSQHRIAALLPLSGRLSTFGIESLNGIRLAMEVKESQGTGSVGLVVKDSETSPRAELAEMVADYRPLAVIGPLLSREVQMLAGFAEQAEIPFITPAATLPDVRRFGSFLFSTALTYPQQARRIAEHAIVQLKLRRFCILYPETGFGRELARLFSQEVEQRGGEIIAVESYKEAETDFGAQIKRLKAEDLKRHGTQTTTKTSKGATRITYTPGFDAIYLPGNYISVAQIAAQLAFYDIKVALLGSNGWNTPDLSRLTERAIDGGIFVDGFFLDSPDPGILEFVERYRRRYQSDPTLFAAQAYDATRLVLDAIQNGATSGTAVRDQLLKRQDLPTLSGPASFAAGGTLNRRVYVLQVQRGKLIQLN